MTAAGRPEPHRRWPLEVRRARPEDRRQVLGFASQTWDGWDYIPHAFDSWLDAPDGVMLVGAVGEPTDGSRPLDRDGSALEVGQVVAVARVARLSAAEAWLEGIRVDPRVRGLDVATDLQVAELQWAAHASEGVEAASVVRYATSGRNEASHRLGARHDFRLLASFRSYRWSADGSDEPFHSADSLSGFEPGHRAAATARRQALLEDLAEAGLVAPVDESDRWWDVLSSDPTFLASGRLHEYRGWTLQELTEERFLGQMTRGEVLVVGEPRGAGHAYGRSWSLAVLPAEVLPSEDVSLHLALVAGDGPSVLRLVTDIARAAGDSLRFRLPEPSPLAEEHAADLAAAGFAAREWTLDILARPLNADHPPPEPDDPAALVIAEEPTRSPA